LALLTSLLADSSWEPGAIAWLLPDLRTASPSFERLAVEYLRWFVARKSLVRREPDRTMSFAAYRLAPLDFTQAQPFLDGIADPKTRAATILSIAEELGEGGHTAFNPRVEACFRTAISQWHPAGKRDSPIRLMIRLAKYYRENGKTKQADAVLKEAEKKIAESASMKFSDTRDMARAKADFGSPDADKWLDMEVRLAPEADEADQRSGDMGGDIHIGATAFAALDLAKRNRLGEALKLVESMAEDQPDFGTSWAMDDIARRLAVSDRPRAIALVRKMPEGKLRNVLVKSVASRIAKADLAAAASLLDLLPPDSRAETACRVLEAAYPQQPEQLIQIIRNSLAQRKPADSYARRSAGRYTLRNQFTRLPLPVLLGLEKQFLDNQEIYAAYILSAVAQAAGVKDDPIWLRYCGNDRTGNPTIPWGPDSLVNAIEGENEPPG
jgi:hypothetical protein